MMQGFAVLWAVLIAFTPRTEAQPWTVANYDNLDFYLHTIEVGDMVFNNFGHTAIRVVDKENQRDMIFNWGIFDFGKPLDFSWRFYRGELRYKLGVYSYLQSRDRYRYEARTVWQDKLLFTKEEKALFWKRLVWNMQPENLYYDYQYFFDNCSTRPRNYIDEALGGVLKTGLSAQITTDSYRAMVRSHYATNPFIAMSLDILMNSRLDRPMSAWEKMFLPKSLRHYLLTFQGEGGRHYMGESEVLFQFDGLEPPLLIGYQILALGLLAFLALPLVSLAGLSRWGYRSLGVAAIVYGAYTGALGLLIPLNHLFSNHLDLHHIANAWLFWPFDGLLFFLGLHWLIFGGAVKKGRWLTQPLRAYFVLHILGGVLFLGLAFTPLLEQDVGLVVAYMLPFTLLFSFFSLKWGVKDV